MAVRDRRAAEAGDMDAVGTLAGMLLRLGRITDEQRKAIRSAGIVGGLEELNRVQETCA
jgi:hypothetical protein